jgi:uncharacterized Tic20 family protein
MDPLMENEFLIKEPQPQPGRRERRLAALAHASILFYLLGSVTGQIWACCFFPFLPLFILGFNTGKDKWVSFHVWQAMIYQVILVIISAFILLIAGIPTYLLIFSKCGPGFGYSSSVCSQVFLPTILAAVFVVGIVPLVMILFGIVGSVRILNGSDFEYLIIGKLLRKWK